MNTLAKELVFQDLPYAYDALEPHIDAKTMEIHHTKHHKAYYDKLVAAIKGQATENENFMDVMRNISKYPAGVRNNGGGYFNHNLFWSVMSANGIDIQGEIKDAINNEFGGFENFKNEFEQAALTRFGSGWAWLNVDENGKLFISSTPNQDNPYMDVVEKNGIPVLGIDVWEHAYYLKYQNRRPEYVSAFWNVINWEEVNKNYIKIVK